MADKQENKQKSNLEDIETVESILNGNLYDFKKIQKKYFRTVNSIIRRMIRNEQDVEDLTQETFIKAYNALNTYEKKYPFSSWILKIASNGCIDYMRKRRLETISLSQNMDYQEEDDLFLQIPDSDVLPDEQMVDSEQNRIIFDTIKTLPENFQRIILLRYQKDLDYSEISDELGIPLGTVKATLFRAKKMLQLALKKHKFLFES